MSFKDWLASLFKHSDNIEPQIVPKPSLDLQQTLLKLHNTERTKHNLPPLVLNDKLITSATYWAKYMADHGIMKHEIIGSTVQSRIEDSGFKPWSSLAENIAEGYPNEQEVMNGWMNSPGHRTNILSQNKQVGFGLKNGYWCADFGSLNYGASDNMNNIKLSGPLYYDGRYF